MVKIEADAKATGQVARHALEASGLRSERERRRREEGREGKPQGELSLHGSKLN
jgi:hypothetical protein